MEGCRRKAAAQRQRDGTGTMSHLYDRIGRTYRSTRAADPRITNMLFSLLELSDGSVICDVGAGSGNYSNALADRGYDIVAVEPSATMRRQALSHPRVMWLGGLAEKLPLADNSVDGIVCTLASHHFASLADAAGEMARICPDGPIAFFTFDPEVGARTWFKDYFPEIHAKDAAIFPRRRNFLSLVAKSVSRRASVLEFPLPPDLADGIMYAPWRYPETYLDPDFRRNTSGFASCSPEVVQRRLAVLRADLESGRWDERYGDLRQRDQLNAGFYFAVIR